MVRTDPNRSCALAHITLQCGLALLVALGWAAPVQAGGYASARFGGERGTVVDTNPTAVYYNPGAVGFGGGTELMLDATLALRRSSYTRDAAAIDDSTLVALEMSGLDVAEGVAALTGESQLHNPIVSPFAGATTDLTLESPLRLGAAFFVPFGGQSIWAEGEPSTTFPGAQDGTPRFYNIEGVIRTLALGFAVAYKHEPARLSFGLALNVYFSEVDTLRARNANGTDNLVASDGSLAEGRSLLAVSGTHVGLGGGVLWEAIEKRLWIGGSYQSQPGFGTMVLEGTLDNTLGPAPPSAPVDVRFSQQLPDIVRLGISGRPHPSYELRLVGDWTLWSRLDQMCLANAGVNDMDGTCATNPDGSLQDPSNNGQVVQVFQRNWQDTFGFRVAGFYYFEGLGEVNASVGYDSSAIPDATLDGALYDMDKMSFSVGGGIDMLENLRLNLTFTEVLYFSRDTNGVAGNESLQLPSRQPGNQGIYSQNIFLINAGLVMRL